MSKLTDKRVQSQHQPLQEHNPKGKKTQKYLFVCLTPEEVVPTEDGFPKTFGGEVAHEADVALEATNILVPL